MMEIKTNRRGRVFFDRLMDRGPLMGLWAIIFLLPLAWACWHPPGFGLGGRYLDGKDELTRPHGGDLNRAITLLESVVVEDALYRDSLTLLGRAYYKKERYAEAFQILQRALKVNPEDEIGWITLGLTQLRLRDDQNGMESLKKGLTLLSHVSKEGYRGIGFWDRKGLVRGTLQRAVALVAKGIEEKPEIISAGENLLGTLDQEEWRGKMEQQEEKRVGY